jgi:hypothetical protein
MDATGTVARMFQAIGARDYCVAFNDAGGLIGWVESGGEIPNLGPDAAAALVILRALRASFARHVEHHRICA